MVVTLTASSQVQIFQLVNGTAFIEFQVLNLSHAHSISSFNTGAQSCIAVARSKKSPTDAAHMVKTVVYCWSGSSNTFVKWQELATRGARHVEFFTVGRSSFLVASCSRTTEHFNARTYTFLWSNFHRRFLLYQYLPTSGAVSSKAIFTPSATYLAIHEENGQIHTTKLFRWNGTYFDQVLTSFDVGFTLAMGNQIYKIVQSNIYRLNLSSRQFDFHSTLPGPPRNTSSVYSSFLVGGSYYIAGRSHRRGYMFVHRMTGFDFAPYQKVLVPSASFSLKVFTMLQNEMFMTVMYGNTLKLLHWHQY